MTLVELADALRRAGLEVSVGADGLVAATDRNAASSELLKQGVSHVYGFGVSVQCVRGLWFLRHRAPPAPAEEFPTLDKILPRALALFAAYQEAPG